MGTTNLYHRRLVADTSAKPCWVCYKPAATVLITPEQDDWFHVCTGHLRDRTFALPRDVKDPAEKKRAELEREIEAVKKEYEEKMRRKGAGKKVKDKGGRKGEGVETGKEEDEGEEKLGEKLGALEKKKKDEEEAAPVDEGGPRVFELQKSFWQMRLQRKRDAEAQKKTRERLRAAGTFPPVPPGDL